ncbi:MAG TPA: hypothetical protein VEL11_13280 [Candidatus Bathyarchaeia archaeon]|nr:hypothetical protein [Candidatus Bathyarchaeia archaeon]
MNKSLIALCKNCFLLLLTLLPIDTATFSPVLHILPVNAYCYQVFIWSHLLPLLPQALIRAGDTHPIRAIRKIKNNSKLSEHGSFPID